MTALIRIRAWPAKPLGGRERASHGWTPQSTAFGLTVHIDDNWLVLEQDHRLSTVASLVGNRRNQWLW